jgi:hypothetical protein
MLTDTERRSILQRIINDASSTTIEREEAERELRDAAAGSQRDEDELIAIHLSRQPWEERAELPESTLELFHALTYWPLALEMEKMAEFVDMLVAFNMRTLHAELKAKSRESIAQWMKIARHYHQTSGADRALRHGAKFLEGR